jgi:hypothetical protein
MRSDDVCSKYADQKTDLSLTLLPDEEGGKPYILISGPSQALHMLAELLISVADEKENDGFFLGPTGPGSSRFSDMSEFGVYIYRRD